MLTGAGACTSVTVLLDELRLPLAASTATTTPPPTQGGDEGDRKETFHRGKMAAAAGSAAGMGSRFLIWVM